jgi:hypothetical protein
VGATAHTWPMGVAGVFGVLLMVAMVVRLTAARWVRAGRDSAVWLVFAPGQRASTTRYPSVLSHPVAADSATARIERNRASITRGERATGHPQRPFGRRGGQWAEPPSAIG